MSSYRVQERNNSFSRTTANEMKMGAYYTDATHCEVIGQLFNFPDEEVCVLEPSIGDGTAVKAVTRPDLNENVKIFGVELNDEVAKTVKEDPLIEDCLSADFTNGVNIRNNAFSFVFGNPPYMDDEDTEDGKRGRLENTFLNKVTGNYLRIGGILVWVIPYRNLVDSATLKHLMGHYEKIGVWKFWPSEYQKWHQVVFVGRKKLSRGIPLADELAAERALLEEDKIEVLPQTFDGTELFHSVAVEPTKSEEVTLFSTRVFDPDIALAFLANEKPNIEDYNAAVSRKVTQKVYASNDLGRPPIMPKPDSLYLMATSGAGQGLAGTPGKDLHLQRGTAEVIDETEYKQDPNNPEKEVAVVTTRTKVSMQIFETSGKFTVLE